MNDTELQSSPIILDRRLVLGEIDYQVTAFPTDDHRIDLCIVSSDGEGRMVSEISGGITPSDLVPLTDVLTSTLSGLIAMTDTPLSSRLPSPPGHRGRSPNRGARWSPADDERLVERFRAGIRMRDLTEEFGRTPGGIRARLEFLGELTPPDRRPPSTPPSPDTSATASPQPEPPLPGSPPPDPSPTDPSHTNPSQIDPHLIDPHVIDPSPGRRASAEPPPTEPPPTEPPPH